MQNKVKDFNDNRAVHLTPMPVYARILDIQSELGELGKEYLKHSKYGTKAFESTEEFELEVGDVLYSVLSLAEECGLDASKCLDKVIDKYTKRIKERNSMGSGR